jgi:5-methylcytosine-specific restriction endonuclease McrA
MTIYPVPKPPKRKRKTKRLSPAKYRQLCEQVARRAGNRCERILPNGQRCNSNKGRLTVHHKKPRAQGGEDTLENCELWCEVCHNADHGIKAVLYE